MTETKWTRDVCDRLRQCGCLVYAAVGGQLGRKGWPDRYVHHALWRGWVEFKGPDTPLDDAQWAILRTMHESSPGTAFVLRAGAGWSGAGIWVPGETMGMCERVAVVGSTGGRLDGREVLLALRRAATSDQRYVVGRVGVMVPSSASGAASGGGSKANLSEDRRQN